MLKKNCVCYLGSIIKKYSISNSVELKFKKNLFKKIQPLHRKKQTLQRNPKHLGFEKYFNNEAEQIILKIIYSVYVNNVVTVMSAHKSNTFFNFFN